MMNSVNLIGNLGADPEIRAFQSGKRVARFSLAVNSYAKDQGPIWITCELWDAAVERLTKCSVKGGTRIVVTGRLGMNAYARTVGATEIAERKIFVKVSGFEVLFAKGEVVETMPSGFEEAVVAGSNEESADKAPKVCRRVS